MKQLEIDIAVIGAGVVGLSCACKLQMAGLKVALLDKSPAGQGCSKGNAGHFATEQVLPLAAPGLIRQIPRMLLDPQGPVSIRWPYLPKIAPWFTRFLLNTRDKPFHKGAKAIRALNDQALPAWQTLLQQIQASEQMQIEGSYLVFESDTTFAQYQNSTLTLIQRYGVNAQVISGHALREAEPALSPSIKHAVFFPDTGHTQNPLKLSETLFSAFIQQGGLFIQQEVSTLTPNAQGCQIITPEAQYQVPKVLIATGAWSKQLVKQATGVSVPLDTERGYHLMAPEAQHLLKVPVSSADRKFILTPMETGMRLAGTVEFAGLEAPANMQRAQMLARHAKALLPTLPEPTGDSWMGCRPSLPDSLPVIDRVGPKGQILLAFAHQHLGLTHAAITAELVVNLALFETPRLDLTPYRLHRF